MIYIYVCVCVCACERACVCACVRACLRSMCVCYMMVSSIPSAYSYTCNLQMTRITFTSNYMAMLPYKSNDLLHYTH